LPGSTHTFNQYVVRVAGGRRDALVKHLKAEGVGCDIYYPLCLHQQECLANLGHRTGDFPASEDAAAEVLALPMYPELAAEQQRRVVEAISTFSAGRARKAG
jgi:dTDP-4-amino-4,6-dideoxygalactose transaminase